MNLTIILIAIGALFVSFFIGRVLVQLVAWVNKKDLQRKAALTLLGQKNSYINLDGEKVRISAYTYRTFDGTLAKVELGGHERED